MGGPLPRCELNGVTRRLERWGASRTAARTALQVELKNLRGGRTELLSPQSRFREAAALWMAKIVERREDSTAATYSHWLDGLVLPQLGELRLYECDVAQLDAFFTRLEKARRVVEHEDGTSTERARYAANTRRTIRAIVAGVMQQAVLHRAVASSPVRELERIESPKGHRKAPPRGLTPEERRRLFAFVDTDKGTVGGDLPDLIRFAIGSGLRIGELCAVRWLDLNLEGIAVVTADDMRLVPVVAVRQNVYPVKGKGLTVHGGKTAMALRIVPLPDFVTTRLRTRQHGDESPEWPVFAAAGRDGQPTYRWPSNVRRSVRAIRDQVDLEWAERRCGMISGHSLDTNCCHRAPSTPRRAHLVPKMAACDSHAHAVPDTGSPGRPSSAACQRSAASRKTAASACGSPRLT